MLINTLQTGSAAPFGGVLAARTEGGPSSGVCWLAFGSDPAALESALAERFPALESRRRDDDPLLLHTLDAVRRYAELHDPDAFDSIPVDLGVTGTDFQRRVWTALRAIPYGQTRTYGRIAEDIGLTKAASRAVGAACAANPVALLVPCHRAIGAGGDLVGFAWGGVEMKRTLLERESSQIGLFAEHSGKASISSVHMLRHFGPKT